jgi:hypothetical protein
MTNSTTMITDITTVITNGPNSATQALTNAASGVLMDYNGNLNLALTKLQELQQLLVAIIGDTAASDGTNLALLNGIQNNLT